MNLKQPKNVLYIFCILVFCSGCTVMHESCSFIVSSPKKTITEKQLSDFGIQHGFKGPKKNFKDTEIWHGIALESKSEKDGLYWDKGNRESYCRMQINDAEPNVVTISGYPVSNPQYKIICDAFESYLRINNKNFQIKRIQKYQKEISVFLRNQSSVPHEKYDKKLNNRERK